jgi:formylmethanofuran dehydrogenase subunit A
MSDVNEEIAKLYFENNNFLIRTNVKYYFKGEKGVGGDSDIDIIAFNLQPDKINPPKNFVLDTRDIKGIMYAAVEVKGWHTETFTPSLIKNSPRIFYFTREEADKKIKEVIRTAHYKKNSLYLPLLKQLIPNKMLFNS